MVTDDLPNKTENARKRSVEFKVLARFECREEGRQVTGVCLAA